MEWGLARKASATSSCPVVTVPIDPQGSPCWMPNTTVSTWSGHRGGRACQWTIGRMSSAMTSSDSNFTRQLAGLGCVSERFQQRCQAYMVQAGGGSVHIRGAFHSGAQLPLMLSDIYLTAVLYRGILRNSLVSFAKQHFGDNYRYQDDNTTPHHARVVFDFFQQGNATKMKQPARSHIWDELVHAITSMDNPLQNLGDLCHALLD